jgi:transcriptional regulator of acetoin/glycerol metabolism
MIDKAANERVSRNWHQFFSGGAIEADVVRPEVARSWQRCRDAGIDPRGPKAPVRLKGDELDAHLRRHRHLLEAAAPFMRFPELAVRGTRFILVLTDDQGIVLAFYGDEDVIARARTNNYVPGCCRSEPAVGTNAIGLAIVERKPIQLAGAEHFNIRHHSWTCASAPIFGPEGAFLGTVTLSGESDDAHQHTLGMVVAAAESIRNRLRERAMEAERSRTDRVARTLLRWMSDPIVTINADGDIVYVNKVAEALLGCEEGQLNGRKISSVLSSPRIADVISGAMGDMPFEATWELDGARSRFTVKPHLIREEDGEHIDGAILNLGRREPQQKNTRTASTFAAPYTLDDIIGEHPALASVVTLARAVASRGSRVLIQGETGTGKELLAQGVHNASDRAGGPFVALNCAAMPRELIEAELFGYKEGAFTGARRGGQIGKFELADGGTLFLDEISQMPLELQGKLLRVLQDGIFTRLGDTTPARADVRIIAATNEDLYAKSQAGAFRLDLYFRLCVIELTLPPLRERGDDIELLAESILRRLCTRMGHDGVGLSRAAMDCLRAYHWPGNIREIENILEMAVILANGPMIQPEHLAPRIRAAYADSPTHLAAPLPQPELVVAADNATLRDVELETIRNALQEYDCNISQVSRALGISRSTVYRKMREIGITRTVNMG